MGRDTVRILLVADTHLGFDLPFRPRIHRRRRGKDFFSNFDVALQPAMRGEVDLVVHGGDLFFRSKVPAALVEMSMAPLIRVAESGVPVCLVPGNHERSRIPLYLWGTHPNLHILDSPRTFHFQIRDMSVALAGFPFKRLIRDAFVQLVSETNHRDNQADLRILCIHQTVEGSRVGPSDYVFRRGPDVITGSDIPSGFAAVLSGHIHRSQMLTHDLAGIPLASPVIYPGSVERTSFAERNEEKHYVLLDFMSNRDSGGDLRQVDFVPLPARPMVKLDLKVDGLHGESLEEFLKDQFKAIDPEAVLRLHIHGPVSSEAMLKLNAKHLRSIAPPTMNVSIRFAQ
ncbi:MAG: metallophosphoesterase [Anaerolineales bacterium]|nr:metallophosphoesterase [Anaerolineales bacterium]